MEYEYVGGVVRPELHEYHNEPYTCAICGQREHSSRLRNYLTSEGHLISCHRSCAEQRANLEVRKRIA